MLHDYQQGTKIKTMRKQIETLYNFIDIWENDKNTDWQIRTLSELYNGWLIANKLPKLSADELILDLNKKYDKITKNLEK